MRLSSRLGSTSARDPLAALAALAAFAVLAALAAFAADAPAIL
jgi:hypothetical protein